VKLRDLSFRTRLALVSAVAVALAVVAASLVVWLVVRNELYSQLDSGLRGRATEVVAALTTPGPSTIHPENGPNGPCLDVNGTVVGPAAYVQLVRSDGSSIRTCGEAGSLPIDDRVRGAARGRGHEFFSNSHVGDTDVRVLTVPGSTFALQVSRDMSEVTHTLHRITIFLILIAAGGILVAAGLGLAVSQAALAPIRRLTRATETVTETRDLSERIDAHGEDELSRLAGSFNTMLGALEESARSQRQLVSDASHELRTPLTSLRTNIEVLARDRDMAPAEREQLLDDVVGQLGEMTALINELVELARGDTQPVEAEDVRLDLLVGEVLERARRDYPQVQFVSNLEPSELHGVPSTIARAVSNLLDNAAKWSPPGGKVEVTVREGQVVVRDHGPGIDDDDLPYVFDRFYRAPAARKLPGSGLGLAIVKQVAEAHGGEVDAERPEDGGTRMRLRLCDSNGRGPA
jgi:two-component system, OmpR family, sensor histidine kinase MprB